MSRLATRDVQTLKSAGRHYQAGALAAVLGANTPLYGCHYGMRSTRDAAIAAYRAGHHDAWHYLAFGDVYRDAKGRPDTGA